MPKKARLRTKLLRYNVKQIALGDKPGKLPIKVGTFIKKIGPSNGLIQDLKEYKNNYKLGKYFAAHIYSKIKERGRIDFLADTAYVFTPHMYIGNSPADAVPYLMYQGIYTSAKKLMNHIAQNISPTYRVIQYKDFNSRVGNACADNKIAKRMSHSRQLIPFKNGVYDLSKPLLREFNPKIFITVKLSYEYINHHDWKEKARLPIYRVIGFSSISKALKTTLNDSQRNTKSLKFYKRFFNQSISLFFQKFFSVLSNNDSDTKKQLYTECLDVLEPYHSFRKYVINIGNGSNGKSVFTKFLTSLADNLVSGVQINKLNKVNLGEFRNTFANIAPDAGKNIHIGDDSAFKKITRGDPVNIERKYENPQLVSFKHANIQNTNTFPNFDDMSKPVFSRLLFVKFNHEFNKDKFEVPDSILDDIFNSQTAKEYFVRWLLRNYGQVKTYQNSKSSKHLMEIFKMTGDPIKLFIKHLELNQTNRIPATDTYIAFRRWCKNNGFKTGWSSRITFENQFSSKSNYVKKRERINKSQRNVDFDLFKQLDIPIKYIEIKPGTTYRCWIDNSFDNTGRKVNEFFNRFHSDKPLNYNKKLRSSYIDKYNYYIKNNYNPVYAIQMIDYISIDKARAILREVTDDKKIDPLQLNSYLKYYYQDDKVSQYSGTNNNSSEKSDNNIEDHKYDPPSNMIGKILPSDTPTPFDHQDNNSKK